MRQLRASVNARSAAPYAFKRITKGCSTRRDMHSLRARVLFRPTYLDSPPVVRNNEIWLNKGEVQCGTASGSLHCICVRLDDNVTLSVGRSV